MVSDSETVRAVLIGLGTGLVVLAIGVLIKRVPKPVVLLLASGLGLLVAVLWPHTSLIEVPDLTGLSQDQAELAVTSKKLVAAAQPQYAPTIRSGFVIPQSQNPLSGTVVRKGTIIRFAVSTSTGPTSIVDTSGKGNLKASVSFFEPKKGGTVICRQQGDGVHRFMVQGTILGADSSKMTLLLWVQPVTPPAESPGWYLQKPPANGIVSIVGDTWRGVCQIGNQQWPPHTGDVVDVAVTLVTSDEAQRLIARQGPMTTIVLPDTVQDIANGVRIKVE